MGNRSSSLKRENAILKYRLQNAEEEIMRLQMSVSDDNNNVSENNKEILWECLTANGWVTYDSNLNEILESKFQKSKEKVSFSYNGIPYIITFSDMKQRRQDSSGAEHDVRRLEYYKTTSSSSYLNDNISSSPSLMSYIHNDNTEGLRIKEIEPTDLTSKVTQELHDFNIATGYYYNAAKKPNTWNNVSKIWVIEYFHHHPVLQKFKQTKARFQIENKSISKLKLYYYYYYYFYEKL